MSSPAQNRAQGKTFQKAWALYDERKYAQAGQAFEAAISENNDKEGYLGLGCSAHKNGDINKAATALKTALKLDSSYVDAYRELGDIYLESFELKSALENYSQAVAYDPNRTDNVQRLIDLAATTEFKNINPNFKGLLTACLERPDINFRKFGDTWLSILKNDKNFNKLLSLSNDASYEEFLNNLESEQNLQIVIDPYFLYGLGRFIVCRDSFERWITYLRRFMLESYMNGKQILSDEQEIEFLHCAVSRYAFFTDYIFDETPEELESIKPLKEQLERSDRPDLVALALYGCYRPLWTLKNAKTNEKNLPGGDHVSQIPKAQIDDYFQQQDIKKEIVAITKIEDAVSTAVQEQYEEFPYPRWEVPFRGIYSQAIEGRFIGKKAKILIAGTGTGQEGVELAFGLPDSEILAVDLSRTSLAYAIMRARQLGVSNATFRQADIKELGSIEQKFDYIVSSGVLHHMKDPKKGWKVLHGLLKPGGLMRIALYSRLARASVNEARHIVTKNNIGNDTEAIRSFRRNIDQYMDPKHRTFFQKSYDYFLLPMCRDLIFHAQEHQFDLLQIKDILKEFNLKFLGFNIDINTLNRYRPYTMGKDEAMTDLELWNKFEEENTDTFASMYAFWCEKQ